MGFTYLEEQAGSLALQGCLTIYEAEELKQFLLDRLRTAEGMVIDLSGVEELDCSGVQLMLLLRKEAEKAGKPLQWLRHSPAVSRVLHILNLETMLGEPVSIVWN